MSKQHGDTSKPRGDTSNRAPGPGLPPAALKPSRLAPAPPLLTRGHPGVAPGDERAQVIAPAAGSRAVTSHWQASDAREESRGRATRYTRRAGRSATTRSPLHRLRSRRLRPPRNCPSWNFQTMTSRRKTTPTRRRRTTATSHRKRRTPPTSHRKRRTPPTSHRKRRPATSQRRPATTRQGSTPPTRQGSTDGRTRRSSKTRRGRARQRTPVRRSGERLG
jgi:hypothetical protein